MRLVNYDAPPAILVLTQFLNTGSGKFTSSIETRPVVASEIEEVIVSATPIKLEGSKSILVLTTLDKIHFFLFSSF